MDRVAISPRIGWHDTVGLLGLADPCSLQAPGWNEAAYYAITPQESDEIEEATREVSKMCLQAVDYAIKNKLLDQLEIPSTLIHWIEQSWTMREPSILTRFDFSYKGSFPPKMINIEGGCAEHLLEASIIQSDWLYDCQPYDGQFNSLFEALVETWQGLRNGGQIGDEPVAFFSTEDVIDLNAQRGYRNAASEAGVASELVPFEALPQVCMKSHPKRLFCGCSPWEILTLKGIPAAELESLASRRWLEPLWKAILNRRLAISLLRSLFPDSPYLSERSSYSRSTNRNQRFRAKKAGTHDGKDVVVESWTVAGEPRGIIFRETSIRIPTLRAVLSPHIISH